MTTGEKIRHFRTLNNLTQKALGDLSGIDEATIRKYELGIRNPKPAQLKKIAQALDIGENLLMDLPFSSLEIVTVGDAMALILLLESHLGITYIAPTNNNGEIDLSKLSIHFENKQVNASLASWIHDCRVADNGKTFIEKYGDSMSIEDREHASNLSSIILEERKHSLTSDTTLLGFPQDK